MNLWKKNAIDSLKSYRDNAKNAGMSDAEINKEIKALKDVYNDTNVSKELKSIIDEIFA